MAIRLYLREMQRLGLVNRALVVSPAHLVTKWQADFERFFGGGLRRITADTAKDDVAAPLVLALRVGDPLIDCLAGKKLTQKYWFEMFADYVLDQVWEELQK